MRFAIKLVCGAVFIFSGAYCEELVPSRELERIVRDEARSIDAREAALDAYAAELDPVAARSLLDYLSTCKEELFEPLANTLAKSGYKTHALQRIIEIIKNAANDPERAVTALRQIYYLKGEYPRDKYRVEAEAAYLAAFGKLIETPAGTVLLRSRDFPFLIGADPHRYKSDLIAMLLSNKTGAEIQVEILRILDSSAAEALRENDLTHLVPLTEHKHHVVASRAAGLLEKVTHRKASANDASPWPEWWKSNQKTLSILSTALTIAKDKNREGSERVFAIQQLFVRQDKARRGLYTDDEKKCFEKIALDRSESAEVRNTAIHGIAKMITNAIQSQDETERKSSIALYLTFLQDPDREIAKMVLDDLGWNGAIDFQQARTVVVDILHDNKQDLIFRSTAAGALGYATRDKFDAGMPIIQFLRELERPRIFAFLGLVNLTGADHYDDIEAWERELLNKPQPPVRFVPNPKPALIADELPVAAKGKLELALRAVSSSRRTKYNEGKAIDNHHEIRLEVVASWPADSSLVALGGYVVEDTVTDTDEKLIADWQQTLGMNTLLLNWYAKPDSQKPNKREQRVFVVELGPPTKPVNILKHVSGYFIVRSAKKSKTVELGDVSKWVGRLIDLPELKPMRLYITAIDGNVIKLQHINNSTHFEMLRGLDFLDGNGQKIPWAANRPKTVKDAIEYEIILSDPLPKDGKIQFTIHDEIVEERVPFEFKDLKLESPIEWPKPPEF